MSEMVHYKGKLERIERVDNETLEEQCEKLLDNKELDSFYDSYVEMLLDTNYKKYIVYNDELYVVKEKEDVDPYDDIFNSQKIDDEAIQFEVRYYNGGCSFSEAIEYALKNMK